ncbi:MAG: HIT family protein, partial [Actinomycetota bacterium]
DEPMPTVFTRIINRELPGRFVYEDDICVAILTIEPISPGHTMVIPRQEVDHWLDLDAETATHLMLVAQRIGRAVDDVYKPVKVGMMIAGLEVPHVHIHVTPMSTVYDLDFARADRSPDPADLDEAARLISLALER